MTTDCDLRSICKNVVLVIQSISSVIPFKSLLNYRLYGTGIGRERWKERKHERLHSTTFINTTKSDYIIIMIRIKAVTL